MTGVIALVCVASESYRQFATDLMDSASERFLPDRPTLFATLHGIEGFPVGTECRHGIFADWLERQPHLTHAFLCDADMLIEEAIYGEDILPAGPGIVATLHPGYVNAPLSVLPYERRTESRACVSLGIAWHSHIGTYYCGGFVGGTRREVLTLSRRINRMILAEREDGRELAWHDESALNRLLAVEHPARVLSPAFAHPDNDESYLRMWPEPYERKIVCLDKTPAQRVGR